MIPRNYFYWFLREQYVIVRSLISRQFDTPSPHKKKRLLFYHINSLGYAGTEKFMQILAKHIDKKKYETYYLYPYKSDEDYIKRLEYITEGNVTGIPFSFKKVQNNHPYFVYGMNPDIKNIIQALDIDLLVTAGSGHAAYPFSIIKNIPIILLNIFGQINIQKNIAFHICTSNEVVQKLSPIVPEYKIKILPVPMEEPPHQSIVDGEELRKRFNIKKSDMVFGRIGRPSDAIFDPIGIQAFKEVVKHDSTVHYLIMSPSPVLLKMVKDENMPNVHFLAPTSSELEVWAFHHAIDALAHYRNDGESFGLNIAESMLASKPILSHKSHIWNAHTEYLKPSFSRVTEKDDVTAYANNMREFATLHKQGKLVELGIEARKSAEVFLIKNNIPLFEKYIDQSISNNNS